MRFDWRVSAGPALTAATALGAFLVDRNLAGVPNPAPLFVCLVAFTGLLSGLGSAVASAAVAIVGSAVFFLDHRSTPGYDEADLLRLAMLSSTVGATAAIAGLLRQRLIDAFALERLHHATAMRLSAAGSAGSGPLRANPNTIRY